jgi:hypothetical protein
MLVNISQGSKLAGISRDTFYKNYINKGKVSTTRDERNRPMVDTSEILRVFGRLHTVGDTDNPTPTTPHNPTPENTHTTPPAPPDLSAQLSHLQAENSQLRERLEESKDREGWQRGQMEKMMDTIKLLEAPRPAPSASFFARLLERLK